MNKPEPEKRVFYITIFHIWWIISVFLGFGSGIAFGAARSGWVGGILGGVAGLVAGILVGVLPFFLVFLFLAGRKSDGKSVPSDGKSA